MTRPELRTAERRLAAGGAAAVLAWPLPAAAQCMVNGRQVPCDEFWADYGWIFGLMGVFFLAFAVFWVWMLVDLLRRPVKDKVVWVLVLIFLNVIGALLYFFIGRKRLEEPARG